MSTVVSEMSKALAALDELDGLGDPFGGKLAGEASAAEAARRLNVSRRDIADYLARGRLDGVASRGVVTLSSIERLEAECKGVKA